MTTRRSAFPVRISYSVNVRSEPILARTDDSLMLNRTAVIVSVDVGNVRFETGALLVGWVSNWNVVARGAGQVTDFVSSHIWTRLEAVAKRGSERW